MGYSAKVIADSVDSLTEVRLTTMEVTFPRIVLAEFNTHRMFSRNSASSRAIPVEKRIKAIENDPFIPDAFAQNIKGMQAGEVLSDQSGARTQWIAAMEAAIGHAGVLAKLGIHKQWANRLIEPYSWQTCIVSATEWDNFFNLRTHKDAQPEIRTIAEMMRAARKQSEPVLKVPGSWHLPLWGTDEDLEDGHSLEEMVKLSVARCARVSYLTHDGKRSPVADFELYDKLVSSGHLSPLEHAAQVVVNPGPDLNYGNFAYPWLQHRKQITNEAVFKG